jgi:uncharacterized radical SAM superfamily protein
MEITSVCPTQTLAVSVTGKDCALDCAHCGKHYLKRMLSLERALGEEGNNGQVSSAAASRPLSYLISGGSTSEGKVPLLAYADELHQLRETSRLNVHPGLVNKKEAKVLAEAADVASFDFIANSDVIQKVYGLNKNVSDYLNSYRYLVESFGIHRVVPHVTLGLAQGQISNETEAVKLLAREGIGKLVLLVFRPTPGTRFAELSPPPIEEVAAALARIRTVIPGVPIYLGCMRPGGTYRNSLDQLAVKCGVNKIVQPAGVFEAEARKLGLEIIYEQECCSL